MIIKNTTPEMHFLILCSKVSHTIHDIEDIKSLCTSLYRHDAHINALITLAYRHAMFPKLYSTLFTHFPTHPIVIQLKPYYFNIAQTNMAMSAQLLKFIKLLHTHNIDVLSFKGPVLAQLLHKNITQRQYGDLDILIQEKDREKLISLLKNGGFHPEINLNLNTEKTFFNAVNVLGFHTPKKDVFIEVHWELLSKNYAIPWKESRLWKLTQTINLNQHPIQTLSPTNHFLYLCVHGSKHLFERLSWVCDIDHFIQTQDALSWEEVLSLAKKLGILRMLLLGLNLCEALLQTPLPDNIKEHISNDKVVQGLTRQIIQLQFADNKTNTKSTHTFKLLWDMRENTTDKFKFIWFALFTPKFDDFKFIQLPNYLRFLYPLIRPLRLLGKYR